MGRLLPTTEPLLASVFLLPVPQGLSPRLWVALSALKTQEREEAGPGSSHHGVDGWPGVMLRQALWLPTTQPRTEGSQAGSGLAGAG